ncbi:MAG: hypothetical protein RMJ53_00760 [Chitinophagales bacterium]|nr:hypothetical protein [Chitinophagales bacterium]MDW8272741.1 hypothetical protein [Chitinophagales bacterium]
MRFFLKLTAVAIIAFTLTTILIKQLNFNNKVYLPFCLISLVFLYILTGTAYLLLKKGLKMKGHSHFVQYFGAMMGLKILASLGFMSYFIFLQPVAGKMEVLYFFMIYFLFNGLLVGDAWMQLKRE